MNIEFESRDLSPYEMTENPSLIKNPMGSLVNKYTGVEGSS